MVFRATILLFTFALASCAGEPIGTASGQGLNAPPERASGEAKAIPVGATFGPDGYATITDAPPAPFEPSPPALPRPLSPEQMAGHERLARAGRFQNEVREQVSALDRKLRVAEKGNYVSLYYDNDGEPSVVFQFLRNGPATLARYAKHPRFIGKTVRFSQEELLAAGEFMWKTFREDRVLESTGIGRNSVTARIIVPEEEFRALVARKGVSIPESVVLEFAARRPADKLNAPLPPEIARFVRIFPRDDRPVGIVHSINSTAKVELSDGCFRIADKEGALVLFPLGAQLFVDRDGYLAFGPQAPGFARVGETVVFPGSIGEVTAPELVRPIHAACGPGKVLKINGMRSEAAQRAQYAITENARMLEMLQTSYGLSEAAARVALERCKAQMGGTICLFSPPPPVPQQANCPAGTKLRFGLCRTPEGYIRPVPKWLEDLVAG